jgi:hypothetical protein
LLNAAVIAQNLAHFQQKPQDEPCAVTLHLYPPEPLHYDDKENYATLEAYEHAHSCQSSLDLQKNQGRLGKQVLADTLEYR